MQTIGRTSAEPVGARPSSMFEQMRAVDWAGIATTALAALLVLYLALENGGYDPIPRDQVGILVWWLLLLGAGVGFLPVPGRTRAGLVCLGLLLAFVAWTTLALIWTESAERTVTEVTRVVTYLGILALGISLVTRRRAGAKQVLDGVTIGLARVAAIGVMSRFQMSWFPENNLEQVFPGIELARRLSYPLNYSSAMGALAGMTIPLLVAVTASARSLGAKAVATAALPIVGFALYLATSGTGVAVAIVASLVFLALAPDRLPKVLTFIVGAGGTAIVVAAFSGHDALVRGLPTPAAEDQGAGMIWVALAVCLAAGLIGAGIAIADRRLERPAWLRPNRRQAAIATGSAIAVAIAIAIAVGAPADASHRWEVFKSREAPTTGPSAPSTAVDFKGNGRYQLWVAAVDADKTAPLIGIGPGTFEFWWARSGSYSGFVRNAHSLYLENLAELGIVGLLIIVAFVAAVLGIGTVRSLRAPPEQRLLIAAATAGATGFAVAAALDWVWQIAALPTAFLLLAAVAVSGNSMRERRNGRRRRKRRIRNRLQRAGVAVLAVIAVLTIWFPLSGATELRQSQVDASRGRLGGALASARDAADAQPYAASPRLQEAVLLERLRELPAAATAARAATDRESTNWRTWLVLSRIESERGRIKAAVAAYERARSLNPRSPLLKGE